MLYWHPDLKFSTLELGDNLTFDTDTHTLSATSYDDTEIKTLINAKQDALTDTQINNIAAVANKQDKLTAGANITITDTGVISSTAGLKIIVLSDGEDLPTEPLENTLYLKKNGIIIGTDNYYDEYIYINNKWEVIGSTKTELSEYALKSDLEAKQDALTFGAGLSLTGSGALQTLRNTRPETIVNSNTDDISIEVMLDSQNTYKEYMLTFNSDNYIKKSELPKEIQIGGEEPTDENIVLWFDENDSGYTIQYADGDTASYGGVITNE